MSQAIVDYKNVEDQIIIKLTREAVNEEDVNVCLSAFETILVDIDADSNAKPKYRVLVDTRLINIHVTAIKWKVVDAFRTHFKDNFKRYCAKISKCAVVVANSTLAEVFQKVIQVITLDNGMVRVTSDIQVAKLFLKSS